MLLRTGGWTALTVGMVFAGVAAAGPTLPAKAVSGGLLLKDTGAPAKRYVCATGVKFDSFQAILTRDKLLLEVHLAWNWEQPETAARADDKTSELTRLPWTTVRDAALVLPKKGDREEVAYPFTDNTLSPDLLTLRGSLADSKTGAEWFRTLQQADSDAELRVGVSCNVATPVVDLRLRVDRTTVVERLERRVTALGGRFTTAGLDRSIHELVDEKIITFSVEGADPPDPTARAWLTELTVQRFLAVLKKEVLTEVKPAAAPTGEKPAPAVFSWDEMKGRQFRSVKGDVTGKYSSVVAYRQTLEIPVKELKLPEQKAVLFLDSRGDK
jgi:hypothetical protein